MVIVIRDADTKTVYKCIKDNQSITCVSICDQTGLDKSKVTGLLKKLRNNGYIYVKQSRPNEGNVWGVK